MRLIAFALLALAAASPAVAQTLQQRIETILQTASPGTRFGVVVLDDGGKEIISINPDGRFIPASNTKMFTTAAAYFAIKALNVPNGTTVEIQGKDVTLKGFGDAGMSSTAGCTVNCLATLADAVAAKTKRVRNITGDATLWPDVRWSPGMSWNNVAERSGTGIAALSLDDNELPLVVTAGAVGQPPLIGFASDYFTIDNRAMTIASGPTTIDVKRLPFERRVIVFGNIAAGAAPDKIALGIDDPAHYAAWRLAALLRERRVRVKGDIRSLYNDDAGSARPIVTNVACPKNKCPRIETPVVLARLSPPALYDDILVINKVSQNMHADILVRRLGGADRGGLDGGLAVIETMLTQAGLDRAAYDFSDGSGMSTYNRVSPRGTVKFLSWVAAQPWGTAWRTSLPVGGVDGTIARRFKGTSLEGRIFAKTGGLNATAALSGYMWAKSGRALTFSILANDIPSGKRATPAMDAALIAIAEAN